jgi:hypothetical protein
MPAGITSSCSLVLSKQRSAGASFASLPTGTGLKSRPVHINGTIFRGNAASQSGGAVHVVQEQNESGGFVQLFNCTLQSNKVTAGARCSCQSMHYTVLPVLFEDVG